VKKGKRSRVQLSRADVEAQREGAKIPVKVLEDELKTSEPNGTMVEIEGIQLKKIDVATIIRHIERHITHWPNAAVFVNHHECCYIEPPIAEQHVFKAKGTPFEERLGDVRLVINVAKSPLAEELQGFPNLIPPFVEVLIDELCNCVGLRLKLLFLFAFATLPIQLLDLSPDGLQVHANKRIGICNDLIPWVKPHRSAHIKWGDRRFV